MALYTYVSNKKQIYKQLDDAFLSMVNYYFKAIQAVIRISRNWEGFEKNPFRDIIETKVFHDSQDQQKLGEMSWAIFWTAAYAPYIRFGTTTPQGVRVPPRAFEEIAAEETDLLNFYAKAFLSGGSLDVKGVVLMSGQEL